jgi:hypothetical protein
LASKQVRAAFVDSIVDQPVSAPVAISEKLQERAGEIFDINNGKPEWHGISTALRARWCVIETLRTLRRNDSSWSHEAYEHAQKAAFVTGLGELLPDRERMVLQQYFIDHCEAEEIAKAIGLSMPIKSQREKFVNEIIARIVAAAKKLSAADEKDLRTLLTEAGEVGTTVFRNEKQLSLPKPAPDDGFGTLGLSLEEIEALAARHVVTQGQLVRMRTNEFAKLRLPESIWREIVTKMLMSDKCFADGETATMQLMGLKGQSSTPPVVPREEPTRPESLVMYSRKGVALRQTAADYRDKLTEQNRPPGAPKPEPVRSAPKVIPAPPAAKPRTTPARTIMPPARTAQIIPPLKRVEPPRERIVEAPRPVREERPEPVRPRTLSTPVVRPLVTPVQPTTVKQERKEHPMGAPMDPLTPMGFSSAHRKHLRKLGVTKPEDFDSVPSADFERKFPDGRTRRSLAGILVKSKRWLMDGEEATRNLTKMKPSKLEASDKPQPSGSKKIKGKPSMALVRVDKPFPAVVEASPVQVEGTHSNGHKPMSLGDFFIQIGQGVKTGTITTEGLMGSFTLSEGKTNYNMVVMIGKEKS